MVEIVDVNGQPIEKKALEEPQTAEIAQLHQEFANHPTRGLTPGKLAQIMEDAERGDMMAQCDLFEDMEEKDGHIAAELGKRKRALLGLPWDIKPPRNATTQEEHTAGLIQDIILDIPNFEDVLLDMADGIGYGFSCLEYSWERKKYWQPANICHRPPRWFTVEQKDRNKLKLRDSGSVDGVEMWPGGWITHIHKAKSGDITRAGLHRALAWPFLFKNYSVRDLAEFLEIYGLPRAVTNMGHAAAGIIPEGMLVEFKEAAKGQSDPYQAMIDWCEKTQSKAIVGGTLLSQADGASSTNALGNVHNESFHNLIASDARQIASTLTRDLVGIICKLNGWLKDDLRCPRFVFDTIEAEDMALFADAIPKLVAVGVQVPESYVRDKLRIPVPEGDEPILAMAAVPAPVADEALKQVALKAKVDDNDPTPTESHTEQLALENAGPVDDWVAIIKAKVEKAVSLEALRDALLNSYGDLDSDDFANIMTIAMASAELSGRFDVEQGE